MFHGEGTQSLMTNFSEMFFLVAIPTVGYLYDVRICRLQPFAPIFDLEIQAALLYDWLKCNGYGWRADSVCEREPVVLGNVGEAQIMRLGFILEPFLEGSSKPAKPALLAPIMPPQPTLTLF